MMTRIVLVFIPHSDGVPLFSLSTTCLLDIDECATQTDNCDQQCVDVEGSFECACGDGYRLLSDNHTCQGSVLRVDI